MRIRTQPFGLGITFWGALVLAMALAGTRPGAAADHVLLVGGLGGEPALTRDFTETLRALRAALATRHGYDPGRIRLLAERKDGPGIDGVATTATLRGELGRLAGIMKTSDTLLLVMIGHGQSDFVEPKFNLPGPDLTAHALAALLDALPARDQRLILAFGCSGHFSQILSRPGRCIIASGDGPRQIYLGLLPRLLQAAFENPQDADVNRDGRLTMGELFRHLARQVDNEFSRRGMLPTENTSLDDNGDGDLTTLAQGMDAGDGERARRTQLLPAPDSPPQTR